MPWIFNVFTGKFDYYAYGDLDDLGDITIVGAARGDILRRGAAVWNNYALGAAGTYLRSGALDPAWAVPTFLELADTPAAYAGMAGRSVVVNAAANALAFKAGEHFVAVTPSVRVYYILTASDMPQTATVQAVAGNVITLTAAVSDHFYVSPLMGSVIGRIYNTTRAEYAWVDNDPAANQLRVTNAADIAAWVFGDALTTQLPGLAATAYLLEIDATVVPDAATGVFLLLFVMDIGAIVAYRGGYVYNSAALGAVASYYQVSGLPHQGLVFVPINADRQIAVRNRATGVNTGNLQVTVVGYTY